MKLICALILWQVLLQVSKEDTIPAESHRIDKHIEEIESNNNQTELLEKKVKELEGELESKNKKIKDLEKIETELRRELESKYDSVGKCSMPTVRAELNRQRKIVQQLAKNLDEKQTDVIDQLMSDYTKSQNLGKCEKKLTSQEKTIESKEKEINQLEAKVEEFGHQLQNLKSITLSKGNTFKVLCNSDIAGPGWTVILQIINSNVNLYRDWKSHCDGFGNFWDGDFFLGLDEIRRLTDDQPHELYILFGKFNGVTFYAKFNEFAIAGKEDLYELKLDPFFHKIYLNERYSQLLILKRIFRDNPLVKQVKMMIRPNFNH